MGAKSAQKIQLALSEYYDRVGITVLNDHADLQRLVELKPDLVFLGLKRLPRDSSQMLLNEDTWLPKYLSDHNINFTGSEHEAIQLDFDKESAKVRVRQAGLPTTSFFTAAPGQFVSAEKLPLYFPLFIKPLSSGSGKGVDEQSVVRNFADFEDKVAAIYEKYNSVALVEPFLSGREFSVAILEQGDKQELLIMPVEIIAEQNSRGDRLLSHKIKFEDNEQVIAVAEPDIKHQVSQLAEAIYLELGGRDLARIDIRMDDVGKAYFLEANFMPGPVTRYFAGACLINEDMDYTTMLYAIAELGLSRQKSLSEINYS